MNHCQDPDQQTVIEIAEGRHLVLAPPGCGKTHILAERVIEAHARGVEYEDMMCLTFTNRASRAMRNRISEHTHNPVPVSLFVGNVHRFCSNYLFEQKKIPQNSAVIDDIDAESIITHLCHLDPDEDNSRFASEIVNLQHALSQREAGMPKKLIVHASLLANSDQPGWERRAEIARMYAEYKETDTLLDFEDMLEKAYLNALADTERHRYRWIQVDEVQDLSFLQLAIIDLFATEDATIVYLGDEQQAIFSFVGAKIEALEELKEVCRDSIHHLGHNHRSPRYLLDIYNTYATQQLGIDPRLLPDTNDTTKADTRDLCLFRACHHQIERSGLQGGGHCLHDGTVCKLCTHQYADEYRMAVALAKRYAAIEPEGRVALIVPTNADADRLSREFGEVPHFKVSGRDLFSTPTVQLIFSHMNVVANETCFIAWARLLNLMGIVPEYAAARNMMRHLRGCAVSPTDLLLYDEGGSYLQHFVSVVDNEEIVLFDTETTGLDVFNDDIIQIAAIKVRRGQYVEGTDLNIIIETTKEIPTMVGGHDNPMLSVYLNSEKMTREEGLNRFLDYCEGHVLVGHNVEFDYNILCNNVRRTMQKELGHRQRFDTLKLSRLIEPRLRVYKLEKLLETLHLEGVNSHNAIDDVKATLSLMQYCRTKAEQYMPTQKKLLNTPAMRGLAARFREAYYPLYLHTCQRLTAGSEDGQPALVAEMQYLYAHLVGKGYVEPVEKWQHIVDYLTLDMIDPATAPTLREQMDSYMVELNTVRESDLCDSSSMMRIGSERYFIATAHKAKGLEFDSVIVFNAVEGAYPYYFNIRNSNVEGVAEDARRFYVAISRAKKHLCFTYAGIDKRGYPAKPTPFLKSIVPMLASYAFDPQAGKMERIYC